MPVVEGKGVAYLNGEKIKAKKTNKKKIKQALDTSSSEKSQGRIDMNDDLFSGFEYSVRSIAILQQEINDAIDKVPEK